jgi:glycosyltransferase involved in cell wall biosynthesis
MMGSRPRTGPFRPGRPRTSPEDDPLRIGIDASPLAKKERTGIARYCLALVEALAAVDAEDRFVLCYRLSRLRRARWFHRVRRPNFSVRLFQDGLAPFLARSVDVFHGPDARVPRLGRVPLVATVHDVFSLDSDAYADPGFREKKRRGYEDLVRRARLLLFVSGHARDRFLSHFDLAADRVRVVPHGVDPRFAAADPEAAAAARARLGLPPEYLLFLGQVSRRKNAVRILEAYASLAPGSTPHLVLAGPHTHGAEEVKEAHARLGLGDRVRFLGHVAEADLAALYLGSKALVFPSLDEGFGLPALEAFACGTPVLASTAGALPETCGDAALLVDPLDVDAIAGGMRRLLDDGRLAADLVRKGRARAAAFTWEATARRTLDAYREAAR